MEKYVKGMRVEQNISKEDNLVLSITVNKAYKELYKILEEHVPSSLLEDEKIGLILDRSTRFVINNMMDISRYDDPFIENGITFMYELIEKIDKPNNKYFVEVSCEDRCLIENSLDILSLENKIFNDPVDLVIKSTFDDIQEHDELDLSELQGWLDDAINNTIDSTLSDYFAEIND